MQTQKFITKKSFRVDELAKELGVKKFIIKNWEKQFDIKKGNNDNKYTQEDLKIFATIKNLVFIKKMPLNLAKKHLQEVLNGQDFSNQTQEPESQKSPELTNQIAQDAHTKIQTQEMQVEHEAPAIQEPLNQDNSGQEHPINEAVIEQWINDQITAAQVSSQINCTQENIDPESTIFQAAQEAHSQESVLIETQIPEDEIIAAKAVDEITEVKPAFKEKEEFFKSLRSFKEQLLQIHEQLK